MGCTSHVRTYSMENLVFDYCPGNYVFNLPVLKWFDAFESTGVMPFSGALVDQPAKIEEVFAIIRGIRAQKIEQQKQDEKVPDRVRRKLNAKNSQS